MRKGAELMAVASQAHALKEQQDSPEGLKESYLTSLRLIERLHRQLLDVIKSELDRTQQNDINSVQALLLFNIGEAELTAGELKTRGHYLGSNVSYNLKKLVEAGYIHHQRSDMDRRSVRVRLTEPGKRVCKMISALYDRHLTSLGKVGGINSADLDQQNLSLQRLERFWADQIRFRL